MFATQRGVVPAARCALAVSTGKAVRGGVRRLGRGSGSSLPGVVALAIDPGMLAGGGRPAPAGALRLVGWRGGGWAGGWGVGGAGGRGERGGRGGAGA